MSEKAKIGKPSQARVNRYGFLALWVGGQALGWLGFYLLVQTNLLPLFNNNWFLALVITLIVGIPTALLQKLALYLGFGRWFKGWTRANLLGWLLGSIALTALMELGVRGSGRYDYFFQIFALMLFPSLVQTWVFSRYVQRVWLWLIASVAGSAVFAAVLQEWGGVDWMAFPAFGMYAAVTGLTLLWLFGMQAKENEVKNLADTSRLEDGAEANAEPEEQEAIERETEQSP